MGSSRLLVFILRGLKPTIAFVGGALVIWWMSGNLHVALTESAPTPIDIEQWQTQYHGQQWIRLTGVAAPESGATRPQTAFIPIVPRAYQSGDPIRAVIITVPDRARQFVGKVTVEGVLAPSGSWDLGSVMPGNTFARDVVCLNEGTTPDGIGLTIGFIVLGMVFLVLGGLALLGLIHEYRSKQEAQINALEML
jgi:hypothetical protein